jgi:hypothetical protein
LSPVRRHILDAAADAFEHASFFADPAKFLVGGSVLHDQLDFAVDGEDDGLAGLFQLHEEAIEGGTAKKKRIAVVDLAASDSTNE